MITDTLQNLPRYRGLHKNLDVAIRWLMAHDPAALPNGRTEIDGDRVFINVMDAALRDAEGAAFEYHHRYADLQIDLTGSEQWGWAAAGAEDKPYDGETDAGFVIGPEQAAGTLGDGRFALFFPGEPHKPSCRTPDCDTVRKAVVKIEMLHNKGAYLE